MSPRLHGSALWVVLGALSLLAAAAGAAPAVYEIDPGHSDVSFRIRHLVSKVRGHFTAFSGTISIDSDDLSASSVILTIQAASVDTANIERDAHLKTDDFFAVERFPTMVFESSRITRAGDGTYDVAGTLTMRGVTKEWVLSVTLLGEMVGLGGETRAGFETRTKLDRKAFGIHWNASLDRGGFVLGDEVDVEINLEAVRQNPPSED